jgi:uncharacterized membrane protein
LCPWLALGATPFAACASPTPSDGQGDNSGSSSVITVGSGSNSTVITVSTGGGSFGGGLDAAIPDMPDARPLRCDDSGHCSCINIASIGHEGVWGACSSDTTTAFQDYLNTQSTAHVDTFDTTKPTLTPDFLAKYDVIILQWMVANGMKGNDGAPWQFSSDEVSALQDWVNNGGGIIALNGYQGTDPNSVFDTTATNQLLSFTDISFDKVVDLSTTPPNAYCFGGAVALGGPVDDGGVQTVGTWDQTTPIGAHVNSVGVLDVRSITATTATTDVSVGTSKYGVHEQVGKGHIVAYGDEWVTYTGEWFGTGACFQASYSDPTNPCYGILPNQIFQIPQFWFNAITYAASSVTCFTITDPTIVR